MAVFKSADDKRMAKAVQLQDVEHYDRVNLEVFIQRQPILAQQEHSYLEALLDTVEFCQLNGC